MNIATGSVDQPAKMLKRHRRFLQLVAFTVVFTIGYYWYVRSTDVSDGIAAEKFISSERGKDSTKEKFGNRIDWEKGAGQDNAGLQLEIPEGNRLQIDTQHVRTESDSTDIPPIIHRVFFSPLLVETLKGPIERCAELNPDFRHWFWTPEDVKTLVSTMYPEYRYFYLSLGTEQQKMLAGKYFILHHFGGYVLDLDMNCRKTFATLAPKQCILAQENQVTATVLDHRDTSLTTDFIACRRRHPFLNELLRVLPDFTARTKNTDTESRVGTLMLKSVLSSYKQNMESQTEALLYVASPETFNPTFDTKMVHHLRFECQRPAFKNLMKLQRLCRRLESDRYANSPPTSGTSYTEKLYVQGYKQEYDSLSASEGKHVHISEWLPKVLRGGNQVEAARKWQ